MDNTTLKSVKAASFLFTFLIINVVSSTAQRISVQDYIEAYKEYAVKDMIKTGVPASITIAQGILESDCGNSILAKNTNNHFGIKCKKEWTGEGYLHDDDAKGECFRKYPSVLDSYDDHSQFLRSRDRYSGLFVLDITDYKGWAYGLKAAGYATNPKYPQLLIKLIEENGLYEFDRFYAIAKEDGFKEEEDLRVSASIQKASTNNVSRSFPPPMQKPVTREPEAIPVKKGSRSGEYNGVKYIIADKGESFLSIADANGISYGDLMKYNDLGKGSSLQTGARIYLEKKNKKAPIEKHIARKGDSMYSISQLYAIRLKKLYKLNDMQEGMEPKIGDEVQLR